MPIMPSEKWPEGLSVALLFFDILLYVQPASKYIFVHTIFLRKGTEQNELLPVS